MAYPYDDDPGEEALEAIEQAMIASAATPTLVVQRGSRRSGCEARRRAGGVMHENIARSHPKMDRGRVWCRHCLSTQRVDAADALRRGWPKCCGYTMTIDPPEEWGARPEGEEKR